MTKHLHAGSCNSDEGEEFHNRFPFRLYQALSLAERKGFEHVVSWLPCGTAFKVHDAKQFEQHVMPLIGRLSRYKSFLRQLNIYKFKRISSVGAYEHPYFRRGHVDLCRGVLRGEEHDAKRRPKVKPALVQSSGDGTASAPTSWETSQPVAFKDEKGTGATPSSTMAVMPSTGNSDTPHVLFERNSNVNSTDSVPGCNSKWFQRPSYPLGVASFSPDDGFLSMKPDLVSRNAMCSSKGSCTVGRQRVVDPDSREPAVNDVFAMLWASNTSQKGTINHDRVDDIVNEIVTTFC